MRLIPLVLVLAACTTPDEVHVGVGHRNEMLGSTDYEGSTGWVEGVWKLKPTEIALDLDTKLFLRGQEDVASHDVTVNIPKADQPKSDFSILLDEAKDDEGNWTPWGLGVVVAVLVYWFGIRRRRKGKEADK